MEAKLLEYPQQIQKAKIMVVDDDPATLALLNTLLVVHGNEVVVFPTGAIALSALRNYLPDLILLATNIADSDAYQLCRQLKQDLRLRDIPVIMLSDNQDPANKMRAFHLGAVDYIAKPFHFEELRARIAVFLNLCMLEGKLKFQQMVEKRCGKYPMPSRPPSLPWQNWRNSGMRIPAGTWNGYGSSVGCWRKDWEMVHLTATISRLSLWTAFSMRHRCTTSAKLPSRTAYC